MTKEQIIADLRVLVLTDGNGITLSGIETSLKIPKNSLSGMLSGSRNLPDKWIPLLEAYVTALAKGAKEIIIPIGQPSSTPPPSDKSPEKKKIKIAAPKKEVAEKTIPPGLSKSAQLRWHRENNQTLQ